MDKINAAKKEAATLVTELFNELDFDRVELPGWSELFKLPFSIAACSHKKFIRLKEVDAIELVARAKSNPHCFDLACYLASLQTSAGTFNSPSIQRFASEALKGYTKRPQQIGTPPKAHTLMDIFKYIVVLQVKDRTKISLAGGEHKRKLSACDVVASEFCKFGHYTTWAQVKSICRDVGYSRFRAGANYLVNGKCTDMKTKMNVSDPINGDKFMRNAPYLFYKT